MKSKNKYIGAIAIAAIIVIVIGIGYFKSKPKTYKDEDIFVDAPTTSKDTNLSKEKIVVEIKGEIKKPEVYVMAKDSIIKDLILEAGGTTDKADLSKINQAMALKKGDCITIPRIAEGQVSVPNDSSTIAVTNNKGAKTPSGKLDLNRATKEELKEVPGIGDVTASKIIDYREKNGAFSSLEDLKKVGRIGDTTIKKFQDYLEVR